MKYEDYMSNYYTVNFWKTFWPDDYLISSISIGNVSEKTIKEYIEKQS